KDDDKHFATLPGITSGKTTTRATANNATCFDYERLMSTITGKNRVFLFLQGPHGPFFHRLGKMLRLAGAEVWRVGFNAGDRAFWPDHQSYIPYQAPPGDWRDGFARIVTEKSVSDIVLYGDTRGLHVEAITEARAKG